MDLLINIFKILGLCAGILFFLIIIIAIVLAPFRQRMLRKKRENILKEIDEQINMLSKLVDLDLNISNINDSANKENTTK